MSYKDWRKKDITEQKIQESIDNDNQARAYLSIDTVNIPTGVWTLVQLDTISYAQDSNFDLVNHEYSVHLAGLYEFGISVRFSGTVANKRYGCRLRKNNVTTIGEDFVQSSISDHVNCRIHDILEFIAEDKLRIEVWHNSGVNVPIRGSSDFRTYFSIRKAR